MFNTNATMTASNNTPPTNMITTLNDHDVLLGRTKECFNWTGNKHFRQYISQAVGRYLEAPTRADKSVVVNSLMIGIQELGGRFLKRCGPQGWKEVEDKHARDKCSHAVRDAANTMAKRGCLEGEQAAKAAQVSTRLARVLSNTATKKRQRKSAVAKSKASSTNNAVTPNTTTSSSTVSAIASTTTAAHTNPKESWNKGMGIVRSVSIVSDSDGSADSPYSSDDESSVTTMTAASHHKPNNNNTILENAANALSSQSSVEPSASTDNWEPLHISMVTPPATPSHSDMTTQNNDDCMLTQALTAVLDEDDPLLIPDVSDDDDKCWFEPNGFQLLEELPLDDDLIVDDFMKNIQV